MILTPVRRGQTQTADDRDYWAVVDAWAAKRWGPHWRRYISDEAAEVACARANRTGDPEALGDAE